MEKILKIESSPENNMDGYYITTDRQVIKILIDNGQNCCENWGYFALHDDPQEFVGAYLLAVNSVNDCLDVEKFKLGADAYMDLDSAIFINIETTLGTLQFTVYNEHNGYYSHFVRIESTQYSEECYL